MDGLFQEKPTHIFRKSRSITFRVLYSKNKKILNHSFGLQKPVILYSVHSLFLHTFFLDVSLRVGHAHFALDMIDVYSFLFLIYDFLGMENLLFHFDKI